MIVSRNII